MSKPTKDGNATPTQSGANAKPVNKNGYKQKPTYRKKKGAGNFQKTRVPTMDTKMSKEEVLKKDREFKNIRGKEASAENDPGWYIFNEQIAKDGNTPIYVTRNALTVHNSMLNGGQYHFTVPSLMTFKFCPTPGPTHDGIGAPVNQQTLALHRRIQRLLSKNISSEFTPGDLAQFIICMDSVIMAYAWAQRVYLLNTYYNVYDPSMPNTLWSALGLNPAAMETNLNWEGYRTKLNIIGDRLSNIAVPTGFKIIARHTWLCSNVFKDSDSSKASLYMFTPSRYYEYSGGGSGQATAILKPWPTFTSPNTQGHTNLAAIIDWLSGLIDRFTTDIDVQTMQGRLRTAFDESEFMKVAYMNADDAMAPVFVPEVLPQIHNMDVVGTLTPVGPNTGNVDQTATDGVNQVLMVSGWKNGGYSGLYGKILDMPFDNPSMEHNYVATRFMVTAQSIIVDNTKVTRLVHYGSEIIEKAVMFWGMGANTIDVVFNIGMEGSSDPSGNAAGPGELLSIARLSHFNMAPLIKFTNDASIHGSATQTQTPTWCDVCGDITNIATLTAENLGAMHVAALMGEWLNPGDFVTT